MRILISGLIIFLIWTSLSSWYYVCRVKGLCSEGTEMEIISVQEPPGDAGLAAADISPVVPAPANLSINFNLDQASFKADPDLVTKCDQFKAWLEKNPGASIFITGYTDATGSDAYNMALGKKRAMAVRDFFTARGLAPERLVISSMGEKNPVADNTTEQGRAKNRRAEVSLNK